MKLHTLKFLLLFEIFFSAKIFSQENSNKFFKTSQESYVVKNDTINIDKYADLIVIPDGRIFQRYFEKIGFFKEVISYKKLVKKVKEIDTGKKVDENNYKKYYNHEKACLTLYYRKGPDNIVELSLGLFGVGSVFTVRNKSTTNIIGINAGTTTVYEDTWDSMMNEIVNFIRLNSKTYK